MRTSAASSPLPASGMPARRWAIAALAGLALLAAGCKDNPSSSAAAPASAPQAAASAVSVEALAAEAKAREREKKARKGAIQRRGARRARGPSQEDQDD